MTEQARHTLEFQAQMEAFARTFEGASHHCLRCKTHTTMKDVRLQWSKNDVPTARGTCTDCDAGMNRTLPRRPKP